MPKTMVPGLTPYTPTARFFHWLMAVLVILQITAGLIMVNTGPEGSLLHTISSTLKLYDGHKLMGIVLIGLVALRIGYRLLNGAPPDEPTLEPWQKETSHMVHGWIYGLLLAVPLLGWLGISLYPAVVLFGGGLEVPGLAVPNREQSVGVFLLHAYAAFALIALIAMHVGAALYHHVIRGDDTLRRMLPGLPPRRD